ncbi:metal-dependent transcriptional regulator [Candidatus Micrarchaeota archaeon]|nr:metal-dependent transcriptional regulator [Candidatus Micrarchaeota archaeon]MBU2477282.1 metal-dependent transcriptional regulator [Candidatus Micrarchaeota archaeon]
MKQKKEFRNQELKEIRHEKSSENEEMYLKVIYILEEDGVKPVCSNYVAKVLNIALPSVVEMLAKMQKKDLIKYDGRKGIFFKPKGKKIAKRIVRNLRLMELLLKDVLKIKETKYACKFEHCLGEEAAEAVNKLLKNPTKCPHGKPIPKI